MTPHIARYNIQYTFEKEKVVDKRTVSALSISWGNWQERCAN